MLSPVLSLFCVIASCTQSNCFGFTGVKVKKFKAFGIFISKEVNVKKTQKGGDWFSV